MNVFEFKETIHSSYRKISHQNASSKHINTINKAVEQLLSFLNSYKKDFDEFLSEQQKEVINNLIELCSNPVSKENLEMIMSQLDQYSSFGVSFLVRHPEPLLDSYDEQLSRNLKLRGVRQVHKFNKLIGKYLAMYDHMQIRIYTSNSFRTEIFAKMIIHNLKKYSHFNIHNNHKRPLLDGSGEKVNDMYELFPDLKSQVTDGKKRTSKKMKLIREHFKKWIKDSKLAKHTAHKIEDLIEKTEDNTISFFFSHENVIGAYIHHIMNVPSNKSLPKYARFVIFSGNHRFFQKK